MSIVWLTALFVLWKFKDRVLVAIGVEGSNQILGDYRDWLTCWGMHRFEPMEIFIWKIDDISTGSDMFIDVLLRSNCLGAAVSRRIIFYGLSVFRYSGGLLLETMSRKMRGEVGQVAGRRSSRRDACPTKHTLDL